MRLFTLMRFPNSIKRPKVRLRRPRIRIRWRKNSSWWAVGVAVAFFVSLFALHVVLMRHAESIVRDILDSRVRKATDGFYSTAFERIEVRYTQKSLIIHNFRLYPDSSLLLNDKGQKITPSKVFDILIPELRIEGINLKKAYLKKELEVQLLSLVQPVASFHVNFDLSTQAVDSLNKGINKSLAPFFTTIESKKLLIHEARVNLHTQKNGQKSYIQASISLETGNLFIKTAIDPQDKDWFQLDNFLVQADSVEGYLAEETYQLKLKSITASSTDSSFYLQGLHVLPMANETTLMAQKPTMERIYSIQVPQLYTYGIDFEALYSRQNFKAAEITFLSPTLDLFDAKPKESGQKENFKPEDLYPAIEKVLNQVSIDRLFIRHGKAVVRNRPERFITNLEVNIREASIYNFVLDSAAQYRTDKLFFSDSLHLDLRNYQLRLSDNLHLLKADQLQVNTNLERAYAGNLSLEPDTLRYLRKASPVLYNAQVPALTLTGVDLQRLYNSNLLLIDSLILQAPELRYTQRVEKQKNQNTQAKSFQQEDFYGLISDYLYQLNINNLSIDGGRISIAKAIKDSTEVFNTRIRHAYLWNLQIDSTSAYRLQKLFYADNFDLEIADYKHQLPDGIHAIEASSIGISTLKDQITISDIKVYNTKGYRYPFEEIQKAGSPTLLDIQIPYLALSGVDILKSYLSKKLEVGEVVVPNPTVHIAMQLGRKKNASAGIIQSRILYSLIEDFTEVISVKSLKLSNAEILTAFYAPNGVLQLNSQNASVTIDNFRFDAYTSRNPKRLFFADAVSVSAQNFVADLPDERYQLKADWVRGSTELNQITAEGVALLQPAQALNEEALLLQGKKGILSFTLPAVEVKGVDFDKAYYEDYLHVDSIIAHGPSLTYYQLARTGKKSKKPRPLIPQASLYESLAPFFQHLSVGTVQLENGTIRTESKDNGVIRQNLLLDKISIAVSNILVDSTAAMNANRFFYSEDIRVHIGAYQWFLPDKIHQITASNLDLSTLSNLIRASAVTLAPISGKMMPTKTPNRYFVKVPEVIMVGIPFDDIFENEEFKLKRLDVLNPSIEIRHYPNKLAAQQKPQRSLPELLSAGLNLMQIDEAVLSGGALRFIQYGEGQPLEFNFPNVGATLTNFSITPTSSLGGAKPFFADNLEVELGDWKRLLPDSIHWLEAASIKFSAKDSLLVAQQLQVYPDPAKVQMTGTDLINAKVPSVRLEGLDFTKIPKDSLRMKDLWVQSPSVQVLQAANDTRSAAKVVKPASAKTLGLIRMDSIHITDGTLVLQKALGGDTSRFELNHVYANVSGFQYDSIQAKNKDLILFSDNLEAGVKNYRAVLDGGFYEIEAKEIAVSTGRQQLWADSLQITPVLDKNTFAKQKGVESDQFTFRSKKILVDSLDLRKLFHEKTFEADKLFIDGFNLYVYRDKRQPFPSRKRPLMPQNLLRNSSWSIMLRETEIVNGYIAYAERVKGAREEGFIDLTNFYVHADTLSNYPEVLASGYVSKLNTSMDLMGQGHLEARFEIPMGDTTNQHMFYGSLEPMELTSFNPILEKTAFISIRSGVAERIEFQVIADAEVAEGAMEFEYNSLRVALVNRKTGKPGGLLRQVGSSLANLFVRSNNSVGGRQQSLRTGEIEVKRDEKRSVVNYWIKTLIGGFKSSIGI